MHYILVARDTRFWLVGPFISQESAGKWGSQRRNNPSDDPRWQTIELADPAAPVRLVRQDHPMLGEPD